ncbi:MAG: hypothetical protein U0798_05570 [Gemmataceae bacterium]
MIPILMLSSCLAFDPAPKVPRADSPAQKVKAALDETAVVAVENKSLNDFVAYAKAKLKVDVQLDKSAVMMMGIDPGMPVISLTVKEGKLRDGLSQALSPLGLRIGAVGGSVVISTEEGLITRQMRQRVNVSSGHAGAVLSDLASQTGANVVIDPRQKAKINEASCDLELTDVTLETAVRLTAEVSGFRAVRMGNVLFITSNERAEKLRSDADGPTQPLGVMPGVMAVDQPGQVQVVPNAPLPAVPPPPPPVVVAK